MNGKTRLVRNSDYPFPENKLPALCNFLETDRESFSAFESGHRSIVFPYKGRWFKAKAIGIPNGVSRPFYHKGRLHVYFLEEQITMGAGDVLWGFLQETEAKNEMWGFKAAEERGLPSPTPVGIGEFDVRILTLKDKVKLFNYLNETSRVQILDNFHENSLEGKAYCVFSIIPSDLRVDEILYAFIFPRVERILDPRDCRDYVKWLGSSCAYNLRRHHDEGLFHGTAVTGEGFNTNSYSGNHIVGETETYMCDYDLAREIKDEKGKKLEFLRAQELFGLLNIMNPLDPLSYQTRGMVTMETARTGYRELFSVLDSFDPMLLVDVFQIQSVKTFRRELADQYKEGVNLGYKGEVYEIERDLRRSMLRKAVLVKEKMWELYGLPKRLKRGISAAAYIDTIIKSKKYLEKEIKPGLIPL